jgi:hypothetical protein
MNALGQLVDCATGSFLQTQPFKKDFFASQIGDDLFKLLSVLNGAFFFNQSLRLFPTEDCPQSYGLETWNSAGLWRSTYPSLPLSSLFFAEDLFGFQFGILEDEIVRFDPETAELTRLASSLEGFSQRVLGDTDFLTGMSIARNWQSRFGDIHARHRLMPKVPFFLGGEFELGNLVSVESAKSMRIRGPIADKVRHLPDGTEIEFVIED